MRDNRQQNHRCFNRAIIKTALTSILAFFLIGMFGVSSVFAQKTKKEKSNYALPNIDLSHWKVTVPSGDVRDVGPPEILDYANNEILKPFMYNDSTDASLVFYAFPDKTTNNSSYSRSELREQMKPGNNNKNWTFKDGGRMKGTLAVPEVSKGADGKYHKVIIMQIHGRLSNEQKELLGEDDNDAPPILKIYWENKKIKVKVKELKDLKMSDTEILKKDSWVDDKGFVFDEEVGFGKFDLEVIVSEGKLTVILNRKQTVTYKNAHMKRWSVFENYFKAGNYFQSKDKGSYAKVKYYSLEVSH